MSVTILVRNAITDDIMYEGQFTKKKKTTLRKLATYIVIESNNIQKSIRDQNTEYYIIPKLTYDDEPVNLENIHSALFKNNSDLNNIKIEFKCINVLSTIHLNFYILYNSDRVKKTIEIPAMKQTSHSSLSIEALVTSLNEYIENEKLILFKDCDKIKMISKSIKYDMKPIAIYSINHETDNIDVDFLIPDFLIDEIYIISKLYHEDEFIFDSEYEDNIHFLYSYIYIENVL